MTKQMKYPIEAFALAMVLFSSGMKLAMIVGIGLVFGDILLGVLREFSEKKAALAVSGIGAVLTAGAIYLMCVLVGITPEIRQIIGFVVLGILLVKHRETEKEERPDFDSILSADACAYGIYVLLAVIREYFLGATIFGYTLPESAVISPSFGKPMFALIGAGIMIAVINRILKAESKSCEALWCCIPAIVLEVPFVWNHAPELVGSILGVGATAVIYLTLRKKLVFANTGKSIEGAPVELVMLGIIYMIFSLL